MDYKQFFNEHMEYVQRKDFENMVKDTYTQDAVLYHNFPFFKGEAPYIHTGHDEIIAAEKVIFDPANQGDITVSEPLNFIGMGNLIAFQLIVTSSNTGKWMTSDAWLLENGKIKIYYASGLKMD